MTSAEAAVGQPPGEPLPLWRERAFAWSLGVAALAACATDAMEDDGAEAIETVAMLGPVDGHDLPPFDLDRVHVPTDPVSRFEDGEFMVRVQEVGGYETGHPSSDDRDTHGQAR